MALVVFLRGVNVGGHKSFQPKALAGELAHLDTVSVGAAGTFVVRKKIGQAALRDEIIRRLPFQAEIMICPAREVLELTSQEQIQDDDSAADATRYVSVLAKRPQKLPDLPLRQPDTEDWQVKIVAVIGRFALSLHRRQGRTLVYPNEVVEKKLGISATTRNWSTILAVCELLKGQ